MPTIPPDPSAPGPFVHLGASPHWANGRQLASVPHPVSYRPRQGTSKVTGTLRGALTAITDMSRLLQEAPA